MRVPPSFMVCVGVTEASARRSEVAIKGSIQIEPWCPQGGARSREPAVAATLIGEKAQFVSVLPSGPMGQMVLDGAASAGLTLREPFVSFVDKGTLATLHVVDDGSGPHPHYQRLHSAFCSTIDELTFAWPKLLAGAKWLHVTGITPPLGAGPFAAWKAAIAGAKAAGVDVCFDLNHRPALGSFDELWAMVEPLLPGVKLLVLSEADLVKLKGSTSY